VPAFAPGSLEFAPALGNINSLGPVVDLSGEVTASTDLFVGDFGVTGILTLTTILPFSIFNIVGRSFHE